MACKIQLSVQGGGAKLVYLMAALRAVRRLEDEGRVEVVRLSGTSAGSLAACLFATRKEWSRAEKLVEELAAEVAAKFVVPSKWSILWKLFVSGKSIWSEDPIRRHLDRFFGVNQIIDNLEIPVKIVSSNLTTCTEYIHGAHEGITDSIMDSCGIPFFFRHVDKRVDGGLCSNLPVLQLADGSTEYGAVPTIALSFPNVHKETPNTPISFIKRLVDVGIDNGVDKAKLLADFACEIVDENRLDIGTLDFAKASQLMSSDTYELIDRKTYSKIVSDFLPKYSDLVRKKTREKYLEDSAQEAKGALYSLYKKQLRTKRSIHMVRMEIIAYSIKGAQPLDELRVTMRFSPADVQPIRAMEFHVEAPFSGRDWVLRKAHTNQNIDISVYHASDLDFPQGSNFVTVLIVPEVPLEAGEEFVLTIREQCQCFEALLENGNDELYYRPHNFDGNVGEVQFIVHFPEGTDVIFGDHSSYHGVQHPLDLANDEKVLGYTAKGIYSRDVGDGGFGVRIIQLGRNG